MNTYLADRIRRVQADYVACGDEPGAVILETLYRDERMEAAWASWERNHTEKWQTTSMLHLIRATANKASAIDQLPATKLSAQQEMARVLEAIELLSDCFARPRWPDPAEYPDAAECIRADRENAQQLRDKLDWAREVVERIAVAKLVGITRDFPASQKRGDAAVAFQVMLCNSMKELVGTPLYAFVATVSDVLFQRNESTSVESVRAAWSRDQVKRR